LSGRTVGKVSKTEESWVEVCEIKKKMPQKNPRRVTTNCARSFIMYSSNKFFFKQNAVSNWFTLR